MISYVPLIRVIDEWHLLRLKATVIPAQAGIQMYQWWSLSWIPACAGMTIKAFGQDKLA